MMRFIPNLLTLANLLAGCVALVLVFDSVPMGAVYCVAISLALDFLDGFAARMVGATQDLGRELDSLADVVSFGVVPGAMLYTLLSPMFGTTSSWAPFFAFLFPVFGAYRLAKFNIEGGKWPYFSGLPIPAAALFWVGLYAKGNDQACTSCTEIFINPYFLLASLGVISVLMISTLPHFNFKLKGKLTWKGYEVQWIYLALIGIMIPFLGMLTLTMAIVAYILLSRIYYSLFYKTD